jgi:FkbM family methyltransferase
MKMASLVYEQYLISQGINKRAWTFARNTLIKLFSDPACSLPIHGRNLLLPLSHSLPEYLKACPFYDRLPQRISEYMHEKQGYLSCIDVGANIGDTIAAFYKEEEDAFLAIEPNPKFNELLSENWGWNKNVTVVPYICSSGPEDGRFEIHEKNGTASIVQAENGVPMSKKSLDQIVAGRSFETEANVLKIDTDGFDFEVIQGSQKLLLRNLPAVLFECDAFEREDYVQDCLTTFDLFKECGYNHFLLYNNFGHLMGKHSFSDLLPFRNLLFFQLTSNFDYFDVLVMKDEDIFEFYEAEIHFFAQTLRDPKLRQAVLAAVEFEYA